MNFDILNQLEKILNEDNSWESLKEKQNEFITNSRRRGTYHEDLNLNEDDNSDEKSEEMVDDTEEMVDDTPDESPSTINLSDALDFLKLKSVLNQFRASHSLSKKSVHEDLEKYFNKLTTPEKMALHVFLKGLVQITLLDVNGKAAYSPKDLKINVKKSGAAKSEINKSERRLDQIKDLQDMPKEKAEEKMKSPVSVIKVGESIQEKSEIINFLKSINS